MVDVTRVPLPPIADGPVSGAALRAYLSLFAREIVGRLDPRNPRSDFSGAVLAQPDGTVTLGSGALPVGRTVSVADLTTQITDEGRAADQRFLPMVSAGNRLSTQDTIPLTSTGQASTSTIVIASHVVTYGFGTVSYNAGSIAGLPPDTLHYVYASDPDFSGGAVSYVATTNSSDVTADDGNYYVGAIRTAKNASTGNVSAATSANPVVITTTGHGLETDDVVDFSSMPGDFAALNTGTYPVIKLTADTFSVAVNGTTWAAYTGGGSWVRVPPDTGGGGGGGWDPSPGTVIP